MPYQPPDITKLRPLSDDPFIYNDELMYLIRLGHFRALLKKLETDPFPVIADQVTVIGDGTIGNPLMAVGAAPTLPKNAVYVDALFGNDATGLTHRFDRPFLTIKAAESVAVAGDTVYVFPGTYSGPQNVLIGKDEVNYQFMNGAKILASEASPIFNDLTVSATSGFSVAGFGEFESDGGVCHIGGSNSVTVSFFAKNIKSTGGVAALYSANSGVIKGAILADAEQDGGAEMFLVEDTTGGSSKQLITIYGRAFRTGADNFPLFRIDADTLNAEQIIQVAEINPGSGTIAAIGGGRQKINFFAKSTSVSTSGMFHITNDNYGTGEAHYSGILQADCDLALEYNSTTVDTFWDVHVTGTAGFDITASGPKITISNRWEVNRTSKIGNVVTGGGGYVRFHNGVIKNTYDDTAGEGIEFNEDDEGTPIFLHNFAVITMNASGATTLIGPPNPSTNRAIMPYNFIRSNNYTDITEVAPATSALVLASYMDFY